MTDLLYAVAHASGFRDLLIPAGRRLTRGWAAFPLTHDQPVALRWDTPPAAGAARLRVSVAIDERDARRVTVTLNGTGRTLGVLDIRYAHIFQPFELALSAGDASAAAEVWRHAASRRRLNAVVAAARSGRASRLEPRADAAPARPGRLTCVRRVH
ncbi:MAG: hypothetical protein HND48_18425 [Chloroflexi bacterium]|nr:hypothetical protein [Chloroflexota bacterium]